MTTESKSQLTAQQILAAARDFFLGDEPVCQAWLESESETSLTFNTFRGNLVIAAVPDPDDGSTTVRVTTLRAEGAVPRLLTYLQSLETGVVA